MVETIERDTADPGAVMSGGGATGADLSAFGARPGQNGHTPPDEKPEENPFPTLRPAALHGPVGALVRLMAPETEGDPVALMLGLLASTGNIIGRSTYARVSRTSHYCNLFVLPVGETAKSRKDTAKGVVRDVATRVDPVWGKQCQGSGLSSGEGLIFAVRDPVLGVERDRKTGQSETVIVDAGVSDKRLFIDESEFATVLKVIQRDKNTLSAQLRLAWDGLDLRTMTRNAPLHATAPHISIVGNITADELRRLMSEGEAANGFMNRFLIVCVKRSSHLLPDGGDLPNLEPHIASLMKIVQDARKLGQLKRDPAATALWKAAYTYLSKERPGLVGALLARGEAQLLRLSCIYAALDTSPTVSEVHLRAAIAVWRYCEESTVRLFGDATGDPIADRLLEVLDQTPDGLPRTELHLLIGRHIPTAALSQALGLLLRLKRVATWQVHTAGRPAQWWRPIAAPAWQDGWDTVLGEKR